MTQEEILAYEKSLPQPPPAFAVMGPDNDVHFHGISEAADWLGVSPAKLRMVLVECHAYPERYAGKPPDHLINRLCRNFHDLVFPMRAQRTEEVPAAVRAG